MPKASAQLFPFRSAIENSHALELICAANTLGGLCAAVDNGADWVWVGFRPERSSRTANLHLSRAALDKGIRHAHDAQCRVVLALSNDGPDSEWQASTNAIDRAASSAVDALLLSDPALLLYAAVRHPNMQLHYAMPDATLNAASLAFLHRQLGIGRILLPRILPTSMLEQLPASKVGLAVSSHARLLVPAGRRPGPKPRSRTGAAQQILPPVEDLCGDCETAVNDICFDDAEASSLDALAFLPCLAGLGIQAIVLQVSNQMPLNLAQATRIWREAIDDCTENSGNYSVKPSWLSGLRKAG